MPRYFQKQATRNKFINKILALHPGKTFEEIIPKKKFDLDSVYAPPALLSRSEARPKWEFKGENLDTRAGREVVKEKPWRRVDRIDVLENWDKFPVSDKYVYRGEGRYANSEGRLSSVFNREKVSPLYTSPQKEIAVRFMGGNSPIMVKMDTSKISKVGPPTAHLGDDYPGVIDMPREEAAKLLPKSFTDNSANFERQIKPKNNVEYVNAVEEVQVPDSKGLLRTVKFKSPVDKAVFIDATTDLPRTAAKNRYFDPATKTFKNKLDHLYT